MGLELPIIDHIPLGREIHVTNKCIVICDMHVMFYVNGLDLTNVDN